MTDLEMTKLCAEAMTGKATVCNGSIYAGEWKRDGKTVWLDGDLFDPLHDDAHAMALVKKFGLDISKRGAIWTVMSPIAESSDLNRAIATCVAKAQTTKVAA